MTTTARLIARMPAAERQEVLDRLVAEVAHLGATVAIEHSPWRSFDQGAETTTGRILGLAYNPGGGSALVLVVAPVDPAKRMLALPVAHLLRIRIAHHWPAQGERAYRLGRVLVGPPVS